MSKTLPFEKITKRLQATNLKAPAEKSRVVLYQEREVTRFLQTRALKKPSEKSRCSFYQDRANFARVILDDLVKRVDALFHRGDYNYAERFGGIGYRPSTPAEAAEAAAEWERFDGEELQGVFDEMLADGWTPEIKGDIMRAINYAWALWVFYQFIAPAIPPGPVADKMAFALAQVARLAAIIEWRVDATGLPLPGKEKRRIGKQEQAKKTEAVVLEALGKLGDVSGMSNNRVANEIKKKLPDKYPCDVKTITKYLKKVRKI